MSKVPQYNYLFNLMENYKAGNLSNCLAEWQKITSDSHILDIVENGLRLDFIDSPPVCTPYEYGRNKEESIIIDEEIQKLLKKKVIKITNIYKYLQDPKRMETNV